MNKYNINDSTSYCLGMSLTIEALKHKSEYLEKVILSEKAYKNEQLSLLKSLCEKHNIEYIYDDKTIDRLSIKENCYAIGVFKKYESKLQSDNHIVLYGFNNFGELGTIIRSAISFNQKDIVLINSDIDYFDPACIRASMGSIFLCNIVKYKDLDTYLSKYPNNNLYPFVSKGKKELKDISFYSPYSLIISQGYYDLDNKFNDDYYINHLNDNEISLSIRSSIILDRLYQSNLKR